MSESHERPTCESCGLRPARQHICYGGTGKSAWLCDECLHADESFLGKYTASFIDEAKNAKCCYCGGFPCSGGPDTLSQITGGQPQNRWQCMSCSFEHAQFLLKALKTVSDDLTQEDQIARLKEVAAEVDAHMAAFVRRRDN